MGRDTTAVLLKYNLPPPRLPPMPPKISSQRHMSQQRTLGGPKSEKHLMVPTGKSKEIMARNRRANTPEFEGPGKTEVRRINRYSKQ